MENDLIIWKQRLKIRKVVTQLGKPFQNHWDCAGEFLLRRNIGGQKGGESFKWEVSRNISLVFGRALEQWRSRHHACRAMKNGEIGVGIAARRRESMDEESLYKGWEAESSPECFQRCYM
jgi:hypothetical protein